VIKIEQTFQTEKELSKGRRGDTPREKKKPGIKKSGADLSLAKTGDAPLYRLISWTIRRLKITKRSVHFLGTLREQNWRVGYESTQKVLEYGWRSGKGPSRIKAGEVLESG